MEKSLAHLCADRREGTRLKTEGVLVFRAERKSEFQTAPLVECTTSGARLVLPGSVVPGQKLEFQLKMKSYVMQGVARVAWTQALSNGRSIAGLQFVSTVRGE